MAIASGLMGMLGKMGGDAAAAAAEQARQDGFQARAEARTDTSPWRTGGAAAVDELMQLFGLGKIKYGEGGFGSYATLDPSNRAGDQAAAAGRFTTSPDYNFRVGEGVKAVERGAAARTGVLNGTTGKALDRFGQEAGKAEYGDYVNRMLALVGVGGNAAANAANASVGTLPSIVNAGIAAGQARQSGYNAMASAVGRADNKIEKWASKLWGGGMM